MIIEEIVNIVENKTILVIKWIDMGGVINYLNPAATTELYFNNPNRIDYISK